MEYLAITALLITNGITLSLLALVHWRKNVWKSRTQFDWSKIAQADALITRMERLTDKTPVKQEWPDRLND
jgi:hypothetical protein